MDDALEILLELLVFDLSELGWKTFLAGIVGGTTGALAGYYASMFNIFEGGLVGFVTGALVYAVYSFLSRN